MDILSIYEFIHELDKLKGVYRKSYVSDTSRHENSAEHSWHLAVSIMMVHEEIGEEIDLLKTLKLALAHDICEIGSGDISVYDKGRDLIGNDEREYLVSLTERFPGPFTEEILSLWEEYEQQETPESQWVKVFDRLLPFCMNIITEGKSWQEQGVNSQQVLAIHEPIRRKSPKMFAWVERKISEAVERGWLKA